MNEFEIINRYFKPSTFYETSSKGHTVALGVGDDCAILNVPEGHQLAVSIDTLNEGIHFPSNANAFDLAQRAFCVCLSDLAAVGAEPLWFTLALTLAEDDGNWLENFSRGLFAIAQEYDCLLVGGNTTRGPLSISIQVHGAVPHGQAITRRAAVAGDAVFVSGPLGDGAVALAILQHRIHVNDQASEYFYQRFYRPQPQIHLGKQLRNIAHAAIDISDGFLADLKHICEASGVGAEISLETLPHSQHMLAQQEFVENKNLAGLWQQWMLSGGDDYQLCFTVPESQVSALPASVYRVGSITEQQNIVCKHEGKVVEPKDFGYQHF